jgi:hypothetical protein
MIRSLAAASLAIVIAGVAPIVSANGVSGATTHLQAAGIGDQCLVGTWHDRGGLSSTLWKDQKVVMHFKGGDIDHIFATGTDSNNWKPSKPLYGTSQGYRLKETIRGINSLKFHKIGKGKLLVDEQGWSVNSTNKYVYRGQHSTGYLNQTGHAIQYYRCTARKLTWLTKKGKVTGTETRVSHTP